MRTLPNLYYLQYFVDAVDLGSIVLSAEKNYISHSAVSRAIKQLEDQLGYSLLERKKRQFKVTKRGFEYAQRCKKALDQMNAIYSKDIENIQEMGILRIGLSRSLVDTYLPKLIRVVNNDFPKWKIEFIFGTTKNLCQNLIDQKIDFAITIGKETEVLLESNRLSQGEFILVENRQQLKTPWPKKKFILTELRPETEKLKRQYKKTFKTDLHDYLNVHSWDVILRLLENECAAALVPDICFNDSKFKNIKSHRQNWMQTKYEIYFHQHKYSNQMITQFIYQALIDELK